MLTIDDLKNTKIGIIGFGKEGQAVARFLSANGLSAFVFDAQSRERFPEQDMALYQQQGFQFVLGKPLKSFGDCSILFRSPGVPRLHPAILDAEAHGTIITSQTKWFFDYCPARIIGVTGTKGKGTTASLIARILMHAQSLPAENDAAASSRVYLTGNIGKDDPFALLPGLKPGDIVVFELSSFQLQDVTVSPHIGVCLMVTQEHLDHHADISEYHAAKSVIVSFQKTGDVAVYAEDYPASKAIGLQGHGQKLSFSRLHPVELGAYMEGESLQLVGLPESGAIDVSKRLLRGDHNLENICAAVLAALSAGVPLSAVAEPVNSFPGLEHRLEYVGEFGGLGFYNDSISTVPESAMAAVRSFTEPKVLILGGSEKKSDFTELARVIAVTANIRGVILIGATAPRIQQALDTAGFTGVTRNGASSMTEIFSQVRELAHKGDVVLLSPACASFGMFQDYKDRGEQFKMHARGYTI